MSEIEPPNRCRLVLVATPGAALADALAGGDVASVIFAPGGADAREFQAFCEKAVPVAQAAGAAALIADDTQILGRCGADGLHVTGGLAALKEAMARFSPKLIIGAAALNSRDDALEKGEQRPDYVFFGKLDGDTHPEAHPKNLELAEWWASMIELPCIVMGGCTADSVAAAARTGAEFVALGAAIFGEGRDPRREAASANAFLGEVGEFAEASDAR
jgi:thiamine-phosphate pyrophosphorylase